MSHFSVAVIHKADQDIEELLAPYDENLEVEPYIGRTVQEMINDAKKRVEHAKEILAKNEVKYLYPLLSREFINYALGENVNYEVVVL